MPDIGGLHHVALSVSDLDRSARWYREVLGAMEVFREPASPRRVVVMRFPRTSAVLGLVEHARPDRSGFDPTNIGLDAAAFTVDSLEDLEAWSQYLTDQGVDHSGVIDIPPGAILNFKDPDGIALVLFWDRPPPA